MFQKGKELEEVFHTAAAFYKIESGENTLLCRSLANIHRMGVETEKVDALFVLLNPGKCLPIFEEEAIPILTRQQEELPLLKAYPDNTLYQLMRLMQRMDWDLVQIINLTDVRTEKFSEYKEMQSKMNVQCDNRHTVFGSDRQSELESLVTAGGTVIAGWGTKSSISDVADEAYKKLSELCTVNGIPYKNGALYYHPFPWIQEKCIMWLDDMESQCKEPAELIK